MNFVSDVFRFYFFLNHSLFLAVSPLDSHGTFIEFSIHVWAFDLALGTHAALSYISVGCPGEEASA